MTQGRTAAGIAGVLLAFCGLAIPGAARAAADAAYGAYLASECLACHQASGTASGGVPSIVGWPEADFVAAMTAYRAKRRDNPVMRTVASALSDEEISALAGYFARLSPAGGR